MPYTCCCSALSVELATFRKVRGNGFRWKLFTGLLLFTSVCISLLPLFSTQTWSFGAAEEKCEEWTVELFEIYANTTYRGVDRNLGDISDNAVRQIFPQHSNNVASLWISVVCLLGWFFLNPHNSSTLAEDLDFSCEISICVCSFHHTPF